MIREFSQVSAAQVQTPNLAEDALWDCEEKYRMLLDAIKDFAIPFVLDPLGQVLSCNAGAERIKGYKAEEIIRRNFSGFFPQQDMRSLKSIVVKSIDNFWSQNYLEKGAANIQELMNEETSSRTVENGK
jgi:PAS domain-containing protein